MTTIIDLLKNNKTIKEFTNGTAKEIISDDIIGTAFLVAAKFNVKNNKNIIVASNIYNAQRIYDLLTTLIGDKKCLFFPVDELLRTDLIATSKEMISQRLFVLNEMLNSDSYVVVTHTTGFIKYLPSPDIFRKNCLSFEVGQTIDLKKTKETLTKLGYINVHKIDHCLQFASRGDILDVFSVNSDKPIRIELFDNQVESIRYFSISNQTSNEEINKTVILPAHCLLFDEEEQKHLEEKIMFEADLEMKQLSKEQASCFYDNIQNTIDLIKNKRDLGVINKYYGFLQNKHYTLKDYGQEADVVLSNPEQIENSFLIVNNEAESFILEESKNLKCLRTLTFYQKLESVLSGGQHIYKIKEFGDKKNNSTLGISSIAGVATNISQAVNIILQYISASKKVIVALDNKQQYELIKYSLKENDCKYDEITSFVISKNQVGIIQSSLDEGFELLDENLAVLTSKELFGFKSKHSKFTNRYKEAVAINSEKDLIPGDYVVHEQHGVGKFIDIITLCVDGIHRDFLHIQYAGTDVLYVPLEQFSLIRKFSGKEGAMPKLNKLGSGEWEKTKSKIKERINEMADRLFNLYKEREQIHGFAFKKDDEFQYQFEQQFPHILTKDQEICLKEIKKDMESSKPMDRLLCGDVGFGKTEIAFRAAFKAILSGKQVAILCPTTLLCRQHYERAKERFEPFDVRIAVFSRLIDEKRQNMYIEQVAQGTAHLIIGTHRLLSKEIKFNNLGLLIIDEEQRFGVEQKELIKELKKNVDVLTLTATPIPRTLQMSLVGIRELSQITTPPENKMPIQTYVMPQKDEVVFELIAKELGRKGQVFYVHNQVSDIYSVALKIEKKIKGCIVGVVHGQMDKETIEDIMVKFYNGEIDVLVCTSIIETGIDIPNVNMIIIENADKFGLSQLYQIKGRVGRGNRIAYAYLLYKQNKVLNDNARKRLKAISDFTELGSGYKIAQRDLLIRGAGDILGPEQAGFIDTVGLDMYLSMLQEAIVEKQKGHKDDKKVRQRGNLVVDAYLPNEYVDKIDKIDLYQEIDNIKTLKDLYDLKAKIVDIYGKMPNEVEVLFVKREILFIVENDIAFDNVMDFKDSVDVILSEKFSSIDSMGMYLFKALSNYLKYIKVTYTNKQIKIRVFKVKNWLTKLKEIINLIVIVRKNVEQNNKNLLEW